MKTKTVSFLFLLIFTVIPPTVIALPFEFGGNLGLENFKWEEFDQNGRQTVEETGARYVLSGFLNSKPEPEHLKFFIYGAEFKLYGGTTDYTDANPVNANTDYETNWSGLSFVGEAGFRAGNMPFAWDVVVRPGFDFWRRSLDDHLDEASREVQTSAERYQVLTLGLGTGPAWRSGQWYGRVIAGIKYSSVNVSIRTEDSTVYKEDVDFNIDGEPTVFLTISNRIRISKQLFLDIDGYYDTYHFKRSGSKTVQNESAAPPTSEVTIPESKLRNYGVQAGVSIAF